MPTDEAEIIARARSALVDMHEARVYSIARHMLRQDEEVHDVFQTVFLRLFQHLGDIDPARGAAGWLRRTTVNACFDRIRARREQAGSIGDDVTASTLGTPVDVAQGREAHDAVRVALQGLPPDYRATVVLHYTEGLSYAEIAETLGVSVETVRSRLKRARAQLRKKLQGYC